MNTNGPILPWAQPGVLLHVELGAQSLGLCERGIKVGRARVTPWSYWREVRAWSKNARQREGKADDWEVKSGRASRDAP